MVDDGSTVESVIQRRIEPSSLNWLETSGEVAAPELALLKRAQRHLSTLHRVSDVLAGARDIDSVSDVTLHVKPFDPARTWVTVFALGSMRAIAA